MIGLNIWTSKESIQLPLQIIFENGENESNSQYVSLRKFNGEKPNLMQSTITKILIKDYRNTPLQMNQIPNFSRKEDEII